MKPITRVCVQAYGWFGRGMSLGQSPLLLAVRLYWGWQFMQTGWGKLYNLQHVVQFFTSLGIPKPGPMAAFITLVELIGGALMFLGLGSRLTALVLTGDMIAAYLIADRTALVAVFSDPGKFYGATPFTFLMASLLILLFGPGVFSIDYWIGRRIAAAAKEPERPEATKNVA